MLIELLAPFVIGFLGSLHCLGMCGPLVLAYSLHLKSPTREPGTSPPSSISASLFHHLFFHLGRILAYGFLGGLAAGLFHLGNLALVFLNLRGFLTLLGGTLMIVLGLVLLKVLPLPSWLGAAFVGQGSLWSRLIPPLLRSQRLDAALALGLATGFLPCGLSWAMMAKAATTQAIPSGFLTMVAFGLGTVPALLATGLSASLLSLKARWLGEKVAALSVIVMGAILLFKGGRVLARIFS